MRKPESKLLKLVSNEKPNNMPYAMNEREKDEITERIIINAALVN